MQFQLVINMDNDAFVNGNGKDVTDISELRYIIKKLLSPAYGLGSEAGLVGEQRKVLDTNGNTVGYWEISK